MAEMHPRRLSASWLPLLLMSAAVFLAEPAASLTTWFGTAPFCRSTPTDCRRFDLLYVRSDEKGSGRKCYSGEKVLCRATPLPAATVQETMQSELAVAVYNVRDTPFAGAHDGQVERTCHVPRALLMQFPQIDAIIFIELHNGGCMQSGQSDPQVPMTSLLAYYGFIHSTGILGENDKKFYHTNGGIMIASRWPIIENREIIFDSYTDLDGLSNKGAVYARLNKKGSIYNVVGTHLQAGKDNNKVRIQQAKELADFVTALEMPKFQPLIIGGEFESDWLGNTNHTLQILDAMLASPLPNRVGSVEANFDYTRNKLMDEKQNVREWVDYATTSRRHQRPDRATIESFILRSEMEIEYCSSATMQPYYVSPDSLMCGKTAKTKELSDHYPVVARFYFNSEAEKNVKD